MPTSLRIHARLASLTALSLLVAPMVACKDDGGEAETAGEYDLEELRKPEACAECHPIHYREWLGSMHAYAAEDPVFRALNAKAQRETEGEIGDFCVKCHAPLAVELGLTSDGLNLDELPQELHGVTCYFCHQVDGIEGTHNNPLSLAMDALMRGRLSDALTHTGHEIGGREDAFRADRLASSQLCGSCHDIVTPAGAHVERTYAEWRESFFSDPDPDNPERLALYGLGCNDCHMKRTTGAIADYPGVFGDRDRHGHSFVGVDVAVTDFPDSELGPVLREEQLAEIAQQRETSLCASVCVKPDEDTDTAQVSVWLHNEAAAHSWPSGSTPDRRAWVELVARDAQGEQLYASGVVEHGEAIAELDDPDLWLLRDRVFDAQGVETHDFWLAASYESQLLHTSSEFGAAGDAATYEQRSYTLDSIPDQVDMRVRLRPIGHEILQELIDSGDLDPAVLDNSLTFDVTSSELEWRANTALPSLGEVDYGTCVSSSPGCIAPALKAE